MAATDNIKAVIERLEAWSHGEGLAQVAAEERGDRPAAEVHWNTIRNYRSLVETLQDALDDLA